MGTGRSRARRRRRGWGGRRRRDLPSHFREGAVNLKTEFHQLRGGLTAVYLTVADTNRQWRSIKILASVFYSHLLRTTSP